MKITALIDKLEARLLHHPLARELCLLAREGLAARKHKASCICMLGIVSRDCPVHGNPVKSVFVEPQRTTRWDANERRWVEAHLDYVPDDPHDEHAISQKVFDLRNKP